LEKIEMKKTLVAVAAIVAVSGAMAESTISGIFQIGLNKNNVVTSGTGVTTRTIEDSNANTQVNITGNDNLDGGNKFYYQIGLAAPVDNAGNITTYQTFAGVSGAFGNVKVGTFTSPQFLRLVAGDATGLTGNNAAGINTNQGTAGALTYFSSNQVQYTLPTFVNGLSLSYTNKLGEQSTNIYGSNTYDVSYSADKFNAGYTYSSYKFAASTTDLATAMSASYDFGVAKVTALSTANTISGNSTVNGSAFGVSVPVGAFSVAYNYGSATKFISSRAITAVAQKSNTYMASYSLSKRTTVYSLFESDSGNNGTAAAATSGIKSTRFFVIHSF